MMSTTLTVVSGDAYAGDDENDRRLLVTVANDGLPVDLTGTELVFMVKLHIEDADEDALISTTAELADPQTGDTEGHAFITLEESDTAGLAGIYHWELQGEDTVGAVTLASGRFKVVRDLIGT